jgi:4-amino-4-deoxy-L-arabinose transferase-like glycosyltransferase
MVESGDDNNLLEVRGLQWLTALLALTMCLMTNLPWHLDDYDQAKQAFTSYEMVKQGHWFYQHTPRERLATKPPLVGWISAGLYEITRNWNAAWRLPSLLSAVAIALLIARNARDAFGRAAAIIGASAFAFNILTPRLATLVRTDMPLALVICAAGFCIWRHVQWSRPWERRERWLIFLLLTAGTLIKGPIIYAFLLPGLLLFQFCRRKGDPHHEWPGWWPWIASLGICLIWTIVGDRFIPGFHDQVVLHEFLGRFSETEHQSKPFYFYLPHLLQKFAPWSLLILAMGWLQWRERREPEADPGMTWLICWIVGGLVVMSLIPSKRVDRIFPIIPPLCLLLAAQIARSWRHGNRLPIRRATMATLAVAVLYSEAYSALKITSGFRHHAAALVDFGKTVRQWAAQADWRYTVVYGGDEGMILYLDKISFTEKGAAISEWNAEKLDALVVPARDAQAYIDTLQPRPVNFLRSRPRGDEKSDYVLLERRE